MTLHLEAQVATLRRALQEARDVAETAIAAGTLIDPEWLAEHVAIALDHPVEPLEPPPCST